MSLHFFRPVEHFGRKFDRGSVLFEFSAFREPEATDFPRIGAWLRAKGIEFNEVPTPSMLWRERLWPDLYIANRLDAVPDAPHWKPKSYAEFPLLPKSEWEAETSLAAASYFLHGADFHATFIEPMCRKISGRPSTEIAAKYHRALWLPLYWPQTLRARKSLATPFHYPRARYAGAIADVLGNNERSPANTSAKPSGNPNQGAEAAEIQLAFVVAAPREAFSVVFVVDDSPIYRVTDMDACAGLAPEFHRLVVEYRGECNVAQELERLGLAYHPRHMAFDSVRLGLPTIENVRAGWKPRPHLNAQLLEIMRAETIA